MLDTVDVLRKLEKDFPHLQFHVIEEKRPHSKPLHRLYLVAMDGVGLQNFEKPIKTSIALLEDHYITEQEYSVIYNKMFESFNVFKLLGLK